MKLRNLDAYYGSQPDPTCECCECRGVRKCTDGCDCAGDCTNREDD